MSTRSILDIEVNTGAFERFQQLFNKYQEKLQEMPGAWKKVGEEQSDIGTNFERMTAAMLAGQHIASEAADSDERRNRSLQQSSRLWSGMSSSAGSVAKSAVMITGSLLKWGTILGGGLLGGSLFGIDRLAAGVSGERRSAMGLGTTIGEQKAFGINFGRLVDPDAFLGNVSGMLTDPRKSWSLSALGVGTSGSTAETAVALLKAMRARATMTGVNQLGLLDAQTGVGAGVDTWRRLHDMKSAEFNSLVSGYGRDRTGLGIADPVALKWQTFTTQMERAGDTIFKTFVEGLAPLSGPLTRLSGAVTGLVEKFVNGGIFKQGIDNLSGWIEGFSAKITAASFQNAVDGFVNDTEAVAEGMHTVATVFKGMSWLTRGDQWAVKKTAQGAAAVAGWAGDAWNWATAPGKSSGALAGYLAHLGLLDAQFGLPAGLLERVKSAESGSSIYPLMSPRGAQGTMQLLPSTARQYGVNANNPGSAALGAAMFLRDLLKEFGGDVAKAAAGYNWGPKNVERVVSKYGAGWLSHAPSETQAYVGKVLVQIQNQTGGNLNTSINGLAGAH